MFAQYILPVCKDDMSHHNFQSVTYSGITKF